MNDQSDDGAAMTPSQTIVAAAARVAEVVDARNRRIKIRKLNALDRMRLLEAIGATGSEIPQYLGYAVLAASVVSIDGSVESPPATKKQLEAMVQRLDDEGLNAVALGYKEHFGFGGPEDDGDPVKIKN